MAKPKDIEKMAKNPTKGRVKSLYALPYHGCMVYLMQVDVDLFMSFTVIEGQIYHFYLEMTPAEGKKSLTKNQIDHVIQILLAGAHTTIETKLGIKTDDRTLAQADEVIKVAERAWGGKKPVLN